MSYILHIEDTPHWRMQVDELYDQIELIIESPARLKQLHDGKEGIEFINTNPASISLLISDLNLSNLSSDPQGEDVVAAALQVGIEAERICLFTSTPDIAQQRIKNLTAEPIRIFDKYGNHELLTNWLLQKLIH